MNTKQEREIMDRAYGLTNLVENIEDPVIELKMKMAILQYFNQKWNMQFTIEELTKLGFINEVN